jgi:shikimate kinase
VVLFFLVLWWCCGGAKKGKVILQNKIIFIGGASASGKTTVAKQLAEKLERPLISLDDFYNATGEIEDGNLRKRITRKFSEALIEQLAVAGTACVVEGGWISVEVASSFCGDIVDAGFCGYFASDLSMRLDNICNTGKHWLANKSKDEALNFLQNQVSGSEHYQSECEKYSLSFFDFSSPEEGSKQLLAIYT